MGKKAGVENAGVENAAVENAFSLAYVLQKLNSL